MQRARLESATKLLVSFIFFDGGKSTNSSSLFSGMVCSNLTRSTMTIQDKIILQSARSTFTMLPAIERCSRLGCLDTSYIAEKWFLSFRKANYMVTPYTEKVNALDLLKFMSNQPTDR